MTDGLTPIEIGALTKDKFSPRDLSYRTLKLTTLDADRKSITTASGFLIVDDSSVHLHTCWHVVTGIDFFEPLVPTNHRRPMYLRVSGVGISVSEISPLEVIMIAGPKKQANVSLGGEYSVEVPLFDDEGKALWEQECRYHRPNSILNSAGVVVPHFLDVVRMPLDVPPAYVSLWGIKRTIHASRQHLGLFSDVIVSGYPYGYSPLEDNLVPIFLKRTVASLSNSQCDIYLDHGCSPAMSGGPVWSADFKLAGMYRGLIFPDFDPLSKKRNDLSAALGIISPWSSFGISTRGAFEFAPSKTILERVARQ